LLGGGDGYLSGALGIYHPIGSPVNGLLGLGIEATGQIGQQATAGLRLLEVTRALNFAVGIDWDARANNLVGIFSWSPAARRGGIFGNGTTLRVDWLPSRDNIGIGVTMPLLQPRAGRTRPRSTGVDLPRAPEPAAAPSLGVLSPSADSAIALVRGAARLIRLYTNFFTDADEGSSERSLDRFAATVNGVRDSLRNTSAAFPRGRSSAEAERVYGEQLARAFAIAAGADSLGPPLARAVRHALLAEVILPFNALYGQVKGDDLRGLGARSLARFAAWIDDSSGVRQDRRSALLAVHDSLIAIVQSIHAGLLVQWNDPRRVWLPLQLALTADEYDEQAEVDALIERAVGGTFSENNDISYLRASELPLEYARSVLLARRYHVLWIHDFAGRRKSGAVDEVGARMVGDVYFTALTRAVRRFDSTGVLTRYFIFLDQNFYEPNDGRLLMNILEDPLEAKIALPEKDSLTAVLRARQQALREAVARSSRLQSLAASHGGTLWLRQMIKVNVSITQPSDFTFRSHRIVPPIAFLPDNLMRDHRKIAFYDVDEANPFDGGMILAGVGIGEHYFSPTWDDRGVVIRGPVVLEARAALRRLMRLNAYAEGDIPPPLRISQVITATGSVEPRASNEERSPLRALQAHNEPGFGAKRSTVARAMLYSLAPRGSVIIVPDGLWLAAPWAGMLAGASLRGCKVFVIAPALPNAPSAGFPQLSETNDVFVRLLTIARTFSDDIARAGGELRVGVFAPTADVNDVVAQMTEVRSGLARYPWIRDLFPFDSATVALLDSIPRVLESAGYKPVAIARDEEKRLPQLHMKTQFIAEPHALAALTRRPEWRDAIARAAIARARQTTAHADLRGVEAVRSFTMQATAALARGFLDGRTPEEKRRATFLFSVGTHNMDPRGMMLDGEASLILTGPGAAMALVDFWFITARSTWVTEPAEFDRLLPPAEGWHRRLARYIRFVL
jgi:hypothetical protein